MRKKGKEGDAKQEMMQIRISADEPAEAETVLSMVRERCNIVSIKGAKIGAKGRIKYYIFATVKPENPARHR